MAARVRLRIGAAFLAALLVGAAAAGAGGDPALGRRVYRDGVLSDGSPLVGLEREVERRGADAACAACHRRSGRGTGEEAAGMPSITAPALFGAAPLDRDERFRRLFLEVPPLERMTRPFDPRPRPPYDDATLGVALREGRDPAGRPLDPLMPRYRLGEADVAHLAAYLRTLGAASDAAVEDDRVHFATVVAAGADPRRRDATLAVLRAFAEWKSGEARARRSRPARLDVDMPLAAREWVLHVWELDAPAATWTAALAARLAERPVLAVLGGAVPGDFAPVHAFCEAAELPCLFPATDLPPAEPGGYAVYLSRGVALEAEAVAEHLLGGGGARAGSRAGPAAEAQPARRIVQVYRPDGAESLAAATAFRAALAGQRAVEDRPWNDAGPPKAGFWKDAVAGDTPVVAAWLPPADLATLPADLLVASLAVAATLSGERPPVPEALRDRTVLGWPGPLPDAPPPQAFRVHAWLRSRGLTGLDDREARRAYLAATVADHALEHAAGFVTRELLLERVEHVAGDLDPGLAPPGSVLSLGPGQRFAVRRATVVGLQPPANR